MAWCQTYRYRYWIDNNVGSAVSGSATGEKQLTISLSAVGYGLHALHVQGRNSAGVWSSVRTRYFLKERSDQTCTSARYWIDNDMTTLHNNVATSGIIELDIANLSYGLHAVHYQKIGTDGTPSAVRTHYFLKEKQDQTCTSARYWIDNDMTTLHNSVATSGIIDVDITKLDVGLHAVHYQKIGTDGTPSATRTRYFLIDRVQKGSLTANISIDEGEVTNYAVSDEDIVIDVTDLADGTHSLLVTLLDARGNTIGQEEQEFEINREQSSSVIVFADATVKSICVSRWDTDLDGELSYEEAATVTSLEDAFDDDIASEITSLNDLQYFTGLTSISWEQLSGCYQLSSIVIPKNVSSIDSPLSQYFPFESISVDPENTVFDSRNDCNAIIETATNKLVVGSSNTIIPATVTAIGNYAFYFSDIQSITIPSSVKSIGQGAFTACSSLQGISLSEGLESIASMAFSACRNVTTILVPSTVTSIGDNAFLNCGFAGLSVASGNTVYDSRNDCNAIIETATNTLIKGCNITVIPASVRRIEHDAFYACEGLTNMEIPEGVNSIGTKAFGWCSNLASVTIPSTITSIETEAFAVSSKLTSVTIYKTTPLSITDRTFPYRGNATLFVPAGTKSLYENASYWAQFKEIVEMEARNEQTLAITSIPVLTYGAEAYTLPQMTNEGLALEWNVDNEAVAVSSANVLTIIGAGTAIVTAIQEGDEDYEPFSREFTLTVNKAALTITANDCTKEEGEENPEFTVSYSGFVNEEDATVLITQPSISTTATVSSQAGTYPIAVSGAEAANYDITYVNGTLTVIPALAMSDRLYAESLTLHSGEQQTIALQLDNETTLIACEFYLQLPDGFSIEKDEDDYLVADIVSSRSNRHSFEATDEGNGLYHFLCYSGQNRAFKGNSGDFITLSIVADDDVEPGSYTAVLKDIIFSDENKVEVNFANSTFDITVANYTPGDVNDDGKINVMDIVEIVSKIMGSPSDNFILDAADIDGNGTVNVMDLVNVVEMIMTMVSQTPAMTLVDQVVPYSGLELGKANANTITMTVPDAWNHIAAQFIVSLTGNAVLTDVVSDKAHQSEYTRLDDGRYMVMVYSNSNASFRSDSPIQLLISGSGNALIEEVVFVDTDKEPVAYDSAMLNTTGIISIGSAFDQPTDIYSVNGKLIKKDATSTRGLAKGVYIVNNEKVIVK